MSRQESAVRTDEEAVVVGSLFDMDEGAAPQVPHHDAPPALDITAVPLGDVLEHDKVRYNTNNCYAYHPDPAAPWRLVKDTTKPPQQPADYDAVLNEVATGVWVDWFHTHYRVVVVPRRHLAWMKAASNFAICKAGMSPMYADDVADVEATTPVGDTFARCDKTVPTSGYFVRTDRVSLKDGVHGIGPYFGLAQIVEGAVTARGGHQGIDQKTAVAKFFLFPWRTDMHEHREFRAFVRDGRVTALSQQSLYTPNRILAALGPAGDADADARRHQVVTNWCRILVPYLETTVVPRLREAATDPNGLLAAGSFVADVTLLGPTQGRDAEGPECVDLTAPERLTPYFIEPNTFGFRYASGSSLFSWVDDYAQLYGIAPDSGQPNDEGEPQQRRVYVRYTSPPGATSASTS